MDSGLRRSLNLPLLVLYGLGTTVGAGIYALIGEIAGVAGYLAPLSFLIASVLAGFTALSFAELSVRYPRTAGAALYVQHGFASTRWGRVIGLLVVVSAVVSCAALLNGFVGYLSEFADFGRVPVIVLAVVLLGLLAAWGIAESVTVAAIVTVIEIGGLLWMIALGGGSFLVGAVAWDEVRVDLAGVGWVAVLSGSVLAFYAFIGFEDMVEVVEEVRDVRRTMPAAIVLTLVVTTVIYLLLALSAVASMPPALLGAADAPLATLYRHLTGNEPIAITLIGLFAIVNGALIQIIMASRVLYGLARRGQLPEVLGSVSPRTQTPLVATALICGLVLTFALVGRLSGLAQATSTVMLLVFAAVNLALWRIKGETGPHEDGIDLPRWLSLAGFIVCAAFVVVSVAG